MKVMTDKAASSVCLLIAFPRARGIDLSDQKASRIASCQRQIVLVDGTQAIAEKGGAGVPRRSPSPFQISSNAFRPVRGAVGVMIAGLRAGSPRQLLRSSDSYHSFGLLVRTIPAGGRVWQCP